MKVAILANNANSYPKPMSMGLQRMLNQCNIGSKIFFNGWQRIRRNDDFRIKSIRDIITIKPVRTFYNSFLQIQFFKKLRAFDLVVVVSHVPAAYLNYFINDDLI